MPIRPMFETHPDGSPVGDGTNKFLGKKLEGHRGFVMAVGPQNMKAVVLSATASTDKDDGVVWGTFYIVKETSVHQWPIIEQSTQQIPNEEGWRLVLPDVFRYFFQQTRGANQGVPA